MKILVTGSNGFIGKNLIVELSNRGYNDIYKCDINTTKQELDEYIEKCEFIFHLAGVNRPENDEDFMKGNFGFTSEMLDLLKKHNNKAPIVITSSIQAELDNPYGKSKKAGEDLMFNYEKETGAKVMLYRLPNVFGKWCRPNYNSVIATFCYNIARDMSIKVNNPEVVLNLVYIDDVIEELISNLNQKGHVKDKFYYVPIIYTQKLGDIANLIYSFKKSRDNLLLPNMQDGFIKKLYSTYLSYLPEKEFSYPVKMNIDERGSFTELLKTDERGQVSVNIAKPGITKGNHWHHTKNEKFIVVSGKGKIKFRKIGSDEVIEYNVSGDKIEVVDIPVGYTHSIENVGDTDMVTIMWANEVFNPDKPDTYYLKV